MLYPLAVKGLNIKQPYLCEGPYITEIKTHLKEIEIEAQGNLHRFRLKYASSFFHNTIQLLFKVNIALELNKYPLKTSNLNILPRTWVEYCIFIPIGIAGNSNSSFAFLYLIIVLIVLPV